MSTMRIAMQLSTLLGLVSLLCVGAGLACIAYHLARPRCPTADLGHRGLMRARARDSFILFRRIEPLVLALTPLMAALPCRRLRQRLATILARAGDPLGLNADELLALSLLEASAGAGLFYSASHALQMNAALFSLIGCALGSSSPYMLVRHAIRTRQLHIDRGLPDAIDLLSLSMSAGVDFAGGLQLLVRQRSVRYAALHDELERVVQALALGQARRDALLDFAARASTTSASDFTNAIIQAERSGTPLRTVLEIQARMLRMRRSVMAEERAAHAALLLLGPLCLLLCAIMIVLFGPFLVSGIGV